MCLLNSTEPELLQLLRQGDEQAFAELYRRYWLVLYENAYQRLNDEDQAKDVIQDVFVRLWDQREVLVVANLRAYLQTAVRYQIYNLIDREKVSNNYFKYLSTQGNFQNSADNDIRYSEMMEHFDLLLNKMPEKRRQIYQLRFEEGLSTSMIAEKLNITQKTVQNQLIKAVSYLRSILAALFLTLLF